MKRKIRKIEMASIIIFIVLLVFLFTFSIIINEYIPKVKDYESFCEKYNLIWESKTTDCIKIENNIIIERYFIKTIENKWYLEKR